MRMKRSREVIMAVSTEQCHGGRTSSVRRMTRRVGMAMLISCRDTAIGVPAPLIACLYAREWWRVVSVVCVADHSHFQMRSSEGERATRGRSTTGAAMVSKSDEER
jgi:hypothetical protein